ncbi:MAG: ornithine cyclodeaminase family protein [Deltaproteobacteria bacterium HGW-Deltaproteobacteria-6]|jgi:alanine dehydrogenase|nr:MAG: ornithine cyclodeaminase family protein [Deltaproteobacteria bacterium HGW-Deltaproteobacteria-6]
MKTLILTRRDVEGILTPAVTNDTVEKAFHAYGLGQTDMPPKSYLYFPKGDLRSMPAYVHGGGFDIAGIKCVTVHPQNAAGSLPTVMAVIILNDPRTGFPLAILDGTYLTCVRTGAAGAIAAKYLSREDAEVAGFVGCGAQARSQLSCLQNVRKIRKIKIWQFEGDKVCAQTFRRWAKAACHVEAVVSSRIDDVTLNADVVVTSTPSRLPLVNRVSAGTHINAIGADAQGKQEINPEILKQAKVVIDDWAQASHSGEINVPLSRKLIGKRDVHAQLGDIVAGKKKGRTSAEEITLFDSTGLAIQDISCAYVVYQALKNKRGIQTVKLF